MSRIIVQANRAASIDAPYCVFTGGEPGLRQRFNRDSFALAHHLSEHPLFALPRLLRLAKSMSNDDLYYDAGAIRVDQRWDQTPPCDLSVSQLLERIENAGAWIILRRIHKYPEYDALVAQILERSLEFVDESLRKQIEKREGIVFISSPNRIATYHIDRECSMLLQIHGDKEISVFDKFDREVLPEEEIERFWTVDNNAAVYKAQFQDRAKVYELKPGVAVHIPVGAPHWVRNHDNVSVSLNVNFQFYDHVAANIYRANYYLRKLGLTPMPPGRSKLRDAVKGSLIGCAVGLRRHLRRMRRPRR
jgi:hypothetical protein